MKDDVANIREQAALWHARLLHDKVSTETRAACEAWLNTSPDHRAAYEAVQRGWDELEAIAELPAILALRHEAALRLTRGTSRKWRPFRALAAAIVLAAVGAAALSVLAPPAVPDRLTSWVRDWWPGGSHYRTGIGERLAATLKDGSQVTLDTQSELEVAFTPAERLVRLGRGQAFFDVAKDKRHPFVVEVRNRRLVAVGTAFDVRLDGAQIRVTMLEGTVRVELTRAPPGSTAPEPDRSSRTSPGQAPTAPSSRARQETLITAGEQLWVDERSADHVQAADADRATSWRRGQLIFDGVRLSDAVAELNRYSETQIQLADPTLADIRISGSFETGRSDVFVEAVTTYFPIAIENSSDRTVVLKARR